MAERGNPMIAWSSMYSPSQNTRSGCCGGGASVSSSLFVPSSSSFSSVSFVLTLVTMEGVGSCMGGGVGNGEAFVSLAFVVEGATGVVIKDWESLLPVAVVLVDSLLEALDMSVSTNRSTMLSWDLLLFSWIRRRLDLWCRSLTLDIGVWSWQRWNP